MRSGVRLESNGKHWRASWIDAQGRRQRKSLGRKDHLRKRDALRLCDELGAKMLLNPRARERPSAVTLAAFAAADAERRQGRVSTGQLANDATTARWLTRRFGDDRRLDRITLADADDFAHWLAGQKLAPVTVAGHVRRARALFRRAVLRGECIANPFDGVSVSAGPPEHDTWVDESMIRPLLDACPSSAWKALVALCAWTGCRRSEALAIDWEAVQWGQARLNMPNLKTRRSTSSTVRVVRMEPDLETVLLDCRETAEGELIAPVPRSNIDAQVRRLYRRAGIDLGGDPFKVWRRWRRQSWIAAGYPEAVVAKWLGHSRDVGRRHYDGVPEQFYGCASPLAALAEAEAHIKKLKARLGQVGTIPSRQMSTKDFFPVHNPGAGGGLRASDVCDCSQMDRFAVDWSQM